MNEQLNNTMQDAATQLINKAMSGLDHAAGFLSAEIPDYVYQLIMWHGMKHGLTALLMLLITLTWFYYGVARPVKMICHGFKNKEPNFFVDEKRYYDGMELSVPSMALLFNLFLIFPFGTFCSSAMTAIQIWIAPKVWLVEYAAQLVK